VLVFDPSAFPKQGTESVGVQRQWCGRLGKVENCQVGIYLGYVGRQEHALVDVRLYLPREWARRRRRRRKAGVPEAIRFRTRHELALEMLDERGPLLPHAWVAGDDELGRCSWFRQELRARHEKYLLAVPCNTLVRDLAPTQPPATPSGRVRQRPFVRADRWCAAVPEGAWQTIEVRPGEKGPIVTQAVRALVEARADGRPSGVVEQLLVFRERQADGTWKHDYLLAFAPLTTELKEFARVFKAEHCSEEGLRDGGEMRFLGHGIRTSYPVGQRPRRSPHGRAPAARRPVGAGRVPASATQAPSLPLPRPQAADQPPGTDRHPVRPEDRHPLERPAARDGLRLGQPLPPPAPGVVSRRHLAPPARGPAG
jgi:hypothetical protein